MRQAKTIHIIDPDGVYDRPCGCGNSETHFVLGIYEHIIYICADCAAEVAKRIIDGLR